MKVKELIEVLQGLDQEKEIGLGNKGYEEGPEVQDIIEVELYKKEIDGYNFLDYQKNNDFYVIRQE